MRHAADVIVVGAATVRIENYSGAQVPLAQRHARQRRGQAEVPPIAVVTRDRQPRPRRAALHPHRGAAADPDVQPIRSTTPASGLARWPRCSTRPGREPDCVDGATALKILAERRLFRVLTEGGPLLLSQLIEDDLLDELCLTVAPILVGGVARRIATGPGEVHTKMRRAHLLIRRPRATCTPATSGLVTHTELRDEDSTLESVLWSACVGVVRPGS